MCYLTLENAASLRERINEKGMAKDVADAGKGAFSATWGLPLHRQKGVQPVIGMKERLRRAYSKRNLGGGGHQKSLNLPGRLRAGKLGGVKEEGRGKSLLLVRRGGRSGKEKVKIVKTTEDDLKRGQH